MITTFLAETIWQQQEGTLMSIEGSLSFIGTILTVMALIGCAAMVVAGSRMARANRIARATHDLIQAMAAEQLKANDWLEKIAARTGRIAPPAIPPAEKKDAGDTPAATGAEVYRI